MIELYQEVTLKDGAKAVIVDISKEDVAFFAEVERPDSVDGIEVEPIRIEDIVIEGA